METVHAGTESGMNLTKALLRWASGVSLDQMDLANQTFRPFRDCNL